MASLPIRRDLSAAELRALAHKESDARVLRRLLALAMALDGTNREEAACQAGMDRQILRDWVVRYNAEGVDGLRDRERPGRPALLAPELEAQASPHFWGWERWILTYGILSIAQQRQLCRAI